MKYEGLVKYELWMTIYSDIFIFLFVKRHIDIEIVGKLLLQYNGSGAGYLFFLSICGILMLK